MALLYIILEGWYFRQGNETVWAAKKISMDGWKKMQPPDLNEATLTVMEKWKDGSELKFGSTVVLQTFHSGRGRLYGERRM